MGLFSGLDSAFIPHRLLYDGNFVSQPHSSHYEARMYKILLLDRCHFSRQGLESWLMQVNAFAAPLSITSLSSLLLAKEHIEGWQPHLIIADLSGFAAERHQIPLISSLIRSSSPRSRLVLLQYDDFTSTDLHDASWAILDKKIALTDMMNIVDGALRSSPGINHARTVAPLLTRQEEKVLSLWMEGTSHGTIARMLNINGKTVYTYKRNIRLKLKVENRFSPFLSTAERRG
jgi:DNA-binding NarL/FixJ family response regulator